VNEYIYLGQTIAMGDRLEEEIKVRKNKGWGKFWSLKKACKNNKLKLKSKIKILESCVMPVLSYGAQTWSLTKEQTKNLQNTQRAMEKKILGIKLKDRVSNKWMKIKTNSNDISNNIGATVKKLKFKYAGHL